jgi:hypothetical protein
MKLSSRVKVHDLLGLQKFLTSSKIMQTIQLTWTFKRGNWQFSIRQPPNFRSAGTTKIWNVTSAEAGLPGNANIGFPDLPGQGMVAKVVGLPGLTVTRPK